MIALSIIYRITTLLLMFASLGLLAGCATTPLASQDKAVLVTATDLQSIDAPLPVDVAEFERTRKIRRIDGGIEIEYHFDAREEKQGYPFIYNVINQETTVSSAVAAYGAVKAGLRMSAVETHDDSDQFHYGDWSYFGTLLVKGETRGVVFYMLDDLTVYTLLISGIPLDVDKVWDQLLLPRLEMLSHTDA